LEGNLNLFKELLTDGQNHGYTDPLDCLLMWPYTVSKPYQTVEEFYQLLKDDAIYRYSQGGGAIPVGDEGKIALLRSLVETKQKKEVPQIPRIDWRQVVRYYEEHPLTPQQLEQAERLGVEEEGAREGRWWVVRRIPGIDSTFVQISRHPEILQSHDDIRVSVSNTEHFYPPRNWIRVIDGDMVIGAISPDYSEVRVRRGGDLPIIVSLLRQLAFDMRQQGGAI